MKEKILAALARIRSERGEIEQIYPAQGEYYFKFRGRYFSVNSLKGNSAFFIYPRYSGDVARLAGGLDAGIEDPDLLFLSVNEGDAPESGISELYEWLQARYSGIDDVLRDIGA